MDFHLRARRDEPFDELRVAVVAETSAFLTECLKHPELATRIPMVPADSARFPPSFALSFWAPLLAE